MTQIENNKNHHSLNVNEWKLSFPLKMLFFLNGATIAFPSLAYMSIINDRAKIPINLLSAYGAISFLPWSFKPLYAFLEYFITKPCNTCKPFNHCLSFHIRRHLLISILLLGSGISIGMTAFIPEDGVTICFIISFFRAILTSFPEFLLGLSLVDEAKAFAYMEVMNVIRDLDVDEDINDIENVSNTSNFNLHTQMDDHDEYSNMESISESTTNQSNHIPSNENESTYRLAYNKISGLFQAQAATSRNIGSFTSSICMFILLIIRQQQQQQQQSDDHTNESTNDSTMTNELVTIMLILTAILPITGSIIALYYQVGSINIAKNKWKNDGYGALTNLDTKNELELTQHNINDDQCGQEWNKNEEIENEPDLEQSKRKDDERYFPYMDIAIIICFQLLIVSFGIKKIILDYTYPGLWLQIIIILIFILFTLILLTTYKTWNETTPSLIQRGPAFFLILKHSMPNISYQWSSYTYHLFHSAPMYLQIISLIRSLTSTLGSKYYETFIASRFTNLIIVFLITTIMSTIVSLLYLIPAHFDLKTMDSNQTFQHFIIVLTIGIITSFMDEISFLPSVVLATNSVQYLDASHLHNDENNHDHDHDHGLNEHMPLDTIPNGEQQSNPKQEKQHLLGLEYGTYVSCIDFGDQLASWMTVPIVSALSINRGDWSHLDDLVFICAVLSIVPLLFLCVLPGGTNCCKSLSRLCIRTCKR